MASVINKGRKCGVYYVKDGNRVERENPAEGESEICVSGMFSELTVDLI